MTAYSFVDNGQGHLDNMTKHLNNGQGHLCHISVTLYLSDSCESLLGEEYSSEHEEHGVSDDSEGASEPPFMLTCMACLT